MSGQQTGSAPAPAQPSREEAFFEAARGLPPEQRPQYLERVCGEDSALRKRLETLLQANSEAGEFLEPPPAANTNPTIDISVQVTEKPGDTIGRYKIREELGEGGCGVVYVAEQSEPVRRRVALKIIKLGMDTR